MESWRCSAATGSTRIRGANHLSWNCSIGLGRTYRLSLISQRFQGGRIDTNWSRPVNRQFTCRSRRPVLTAFPLTELAFAPGIESDRAEGDWVECRAVEPNERRNLASVGSHLETGRRSTGKTRRRSAASQRHLESSVPGPELRAPGQRLNLSGVPNRTGYELHPPAETSAAPLWAAHHQLIDRSGIDKWRETCLDNAC